MSSEQIVPEYLKSIKVSCICTNGEFKGQHISITKVLCCCGSSSLHQEKLLETKVLLSKAKNETEWAKLG